MVYCTKCGALNNDEAVHCSSCGTSLFFDNSSNSPKNVHQLHSGKISSHNRGGNGFGLLIAGLFIIVIGLATLTGFKLFWDYFWPIVLVFIGLWILVKGLNRNRRYRQALS